MKGLGTNMTPKSGAAYDTAKDMILYLNAREVLVQEVGVGAD